MSSSRILLDAARFIDSPEALAIDAADTATIRTIAQRFLECAYEGVGKAPRLLDGDDLASILHEHLPARFGVRDEAAGAVPQVLAAYIDHLETAEVVTHLFELRSALQSHGDAFLIAVQSGRAHEGGLRGKAAPTIQNAVERTGRNDSCPCGSGKKFKKCCLRLS